MTNSTTGTRPCGCSAGDPHLSDCPTVTGGPSGRTMDDYLDQPSLFDDDQ